jgi:hypothetical protein
MPEKEPTFTVTDRRKFTLEGDLREETASESEVKNSVQTEEKAAANNDAGPTAEQSSRQASEYHASSRELDEALRRASPGGHTDLPMSFERLVQSVYMTAAVQMGAGTAPNEQPQIDIIGARESIDMLAILEEKTKGNLTQDEKRLLQNALFDLRMSFLEITKAINSSAKRPPKPGGAGHK